MIYQNRKTENSKILLPSKKAFIVIVIIGAVGAILGMSFSRELRFLTVCQVTDIPGHVVVGFKKGVASREAEKLFTDAKLTYVQTDDVNLGKEFFYKTDLKYIVNVTVGQEGYWIKKFLQSPLVVRVNCHPDPAKITID